MNNSQTHTPGPWTAEPEAHENDYGYGCLVTSPFSVNEYGAVAMVPGFRDAPATARLIATSPHMYEVLAAIAAIRKDGECDEGHGPTEHEPNDACFVLEPDLALDALHDAIDCARQAIAQATR